MFPIESEINKEVWVTSEVTAIHYGTRSGEKHIHNTQSISQSIAQLYIKFLNLQDKYRKYNKSNDYSSFAIAQRF